MTVILHPPPLICIIPIIHALDARGWKNSSYFCDHGGADTYAPFPRL
jgi:hypothetical protein